MSERFCGERAFALLRAQCDMGPRIPGSPGHARALAFLEEELRPCVEDLTRQSWEQSIARGPGIGRTFAMTNLLARIRGRSDDGKPVSEIRPDLMLSAHWDTRPIANKDPLFWRRRRPVPGASDGASGVAVLLEIARALTERRPEKTVLLAFWDGEDLGEYFYGSKHFAAQLGNEEESRWRARQGIVVDMIGGKNLRCTRELRSLRHAPELWESVHASADALGYADSFDGPERAIRDDHVPLSEAGIPTIVLIDFSYPYHHTTGDCPDKCGPESLQIVGDVLLHFIHENTG